MRNGRPVLAGKFSAFPRTKKFRRGALKKKMTSPGTVFSDGCAGMDFVKNRGK
jgi:hypothetical protein